MAQKVHAITINKEKLSQRNIEKKIPFEPLKEKNRTLSNNFHSKIKKTDKKILNSVFVKGNKTVYSSTKNIKQNNHIDKYYSNYIINGNVFHNDYISDYLPEIRLNHNEDTMRETDNKIEELVNNLNIYKNKRLKKIRSQKIINTFNKNTYNNYINEKNKQKKAESTTTNDKDENLLMNNNYKQSNTNDKFKDHYLYKKIFFYSDKKKIIKSESFLDNKLNIIYAENENQYKQNLLKLNEIYRKIGKNKIFTLEPSKSQNKIKALKKRVEFMKRIVDYTYPDMVLTKIKEEESKINERNNNLTNIITSKINRKNNLKFNY
jgi:hypothetical protein